MKKKKKCHDLLGLKIVRSEKNIICTQEKSESEKWVVQISSQHLYGNAVRVCANFAGKRERNCSASDVKTAELE